MPYFLMGSRPNVGFLLEAVQTGEFSSRKLQIFLKPILAQYCVPFAFVLASLIENMSAAQTLRPQPI